MKSEFIKWAATKTFSFDDAIEEGFEKEFDGNVDILKMINIPTPWRPGFFILDVEKMIESFKPKKTTMQFNECKTCGAKDGRAGILINGECLNCNKTRKTGKFTLDATLRRTYEEVAKTAEILEEKS